MTVEHAVITGTYHDSVTLMRIATDIRTELDVEEAFAVMGTQANKQTLVEADLIEFHELTGLHGDDLVLVAKDADAEQAASAIDQMRERLLESGETAAPGGPEARPPRSLATAVDRLESPGLAFVSVPAEYAVREAWHGLHRDLHVHLFSDGVSVEEERRLKQFGRDNDLLVMGPDCGTAILGGTPFGFANEVARGSVGIVAAAGTGLQEVASLIDRAGGGISHAIGTGGRDLIDEVGGITTLQGIDLFASHEDTDVVVLLSKPPGEETERTVIERIDDYPIPVIVTFLGSSSEPIESAGARPAATLEAAAREAIVALEGADPNDITFEADLDGFANRSGSQGRVENVGKNGRLRGLFTGGTLCAESALVLQGVLDEVRTNVGVGDQVDDPLAPTGHALIDLGVDELTRGRPHPMINPSLRNEHLEAALDADEVSVLLLDVVLGYGAHDHPAGAVVDVLARKDDDTLVIASVCGTRGDPQSLSRQVATLDEAGVLVRPTTASAARLAGEAIAGTTGGEQA